MKSNEWVPLSPKLEKQNPILLARKPKGLGQEKADWSRNRICDPGLVVFSQWPVLGLRPTLSSHSPSEVREAGVTQPTYTLVLHSQHRRNPQRTHLLPKCLPNILREHKMLRSWEVWGWNGKEKFKVRILYLLNCLGLLSRNRAPYPGVS